MLSPIISGYTVIAIFYSLGFATGTYIGGIVSNRFINIKLGLQVVLSKNDKNIIKIKIYENKSWILIFFYKKYCEFSV